MTTPLFGSSRNSQINDDNKMNVIQCPFFCFRFCQVHRVLIPEVEIKRRVPRRSLVFFVDPDPSTLITCLDGSNKYPPITSGEWIKGKLYATYKY